MKEMTTFTCCKHSPTGSSSWLIFWRRKFLKQLTRSHLLLILDFVVFRLKSNLKFYIAADTDWHTFAWHSIAPAIILACYHYSFWHCYCWCYCYFFKFFIVFALHSICTIICTSHYCRLLLEVSFFFTL